MASAETWAPSEPPKESGSAAVHDPRPRHASAETEQAEDTGIEGLLVTLDGVEKEQRSRGRLALAGVIVAAITAAILAFVAAAYLVHAPSPADAPSVTTEQQ